MAAKLSFECQYCHSIYKVQEKLTAHQDYCKVKKEQLKKESTDLKNTLSQGEKFAKLKDLSERLSEVFAREGILGGCVLGAAALIEACEILNHPYRLVDGYLITDHQIAVRHMWVDINGETIDPSVNALKQIVPEFRDAQVNYSVQLPPTAKRIDRDAEGEIAILADIENYIRLLEVSSNNFWLCASDKDQIGYKKRRLIESQLRHLNK